ncbi:MAG TPA: ATP-binding cassette domain-containing protein [Anaeromyxobacteraceae bacterium]|jgi:molybdate transport system ATP-binding protein|nr:ATP-binding cassette domain-containing protein [Anaeromyxobacteraceae bacterium]
MAVPLVTLENASVVLAGARVLEGISFTLRDGESWAVLGRNGSGKSTFLKLLRGEVWPAPGGGRRLYHLDGPPQESPIGMRDRIALVSAEQQEAYHKRDWDLDADAVILSGFTDSVYRQEPPTEAERRRAGEVAAELGVERLLGRRFLSLSTGEARRVLLARALAPRPRVLLLDEAANGLDAVSRRRFLEAVSRVARGGLPVVMATHRAEEVLPEMTRVARMDGGRLEVLAGEGRRPLSPPQGAPGLPLPAARGVPGSGGHEARAPAASPLLHLERASVNVSGHPVLHALDWTVLPGESWAVLGPNGAGKSTLIRLLAGEEQPMPGGRVRRLGLPSRTGLWELRARVALVSPELQARHRYEERGEEVVLSGFFGSIGLPEEPTPAQREAARRWMDRLGAAHLAARRVQALSHGELRRLLLARALVREPELLLLDEPCDGLDASSRAELLALLESLCRGGLHLVLASHHASDLIPSIDHVLELEGGRVRRAGPRA